MQSITYRKLVGVYSIIIFICYFTMVKVNKKGKKKIVKWGVKAIKGRFLLRPAFFRPSISDQHICTVDLDLRMHKSG
jgi:hypothetical protein